MHTRLPAFSVAAVFYVAALILLPLAVIPMSGISPDAQKGLIAAGAFGLAAMLSLYGIFSRRSKNGFSLFAFAGVPLVLVAAISAFFSPAVVFSFWGSGFELGTVGSFILFAGALAGGYYLPQVFYKIFFVAYIWIVICAASLSALVYVFHITTNAALFDSWTQLSFLLASVLLMSVVFCDGCDELWPKIVVGVAAVAASIMFVLFFHQTAAAVLVGLTVLWIGVWFLVMQKRAIPLFSLALCGLLVLVFMVHNGPAFNMPADISISPKVTLKMAETLYSHSAADALIGSGPHTFSMLWDLYRPIELNASTLWNVGFNEGYSSAFTFALTVGVLGLAAYLLPLFVTLVSTARRWRNMPQGEESTFFAWIFCAVLSYTAAFFYNIEVPLFLIGAVALGVSWRMMHPKLSQETGFGTKILCVLLALCGAGSLWIAGHQLVAASNYNAGLQAFTGGNVDRARGQFEVAANSWPTALYARDAARAELESVRVATGTQMISDTETKARLTKSHTYVTLAVALAPEFNSWIANTSVDLALPESVLRDAQSEISQSLTEAQKRSPLRPETEYLYAVFARSLGNTAEALAHLERSLALKADYAPAAALKAELLAN